MPVINVFEQTAQLGRPTDNTSRVRPDNSGAMAIARENAGIARTLAVGIDNLQENITKADIMAANNEYNRKMNELTLKLQQNKEQKALNNMEVYEKERQKIVDSILKNGPASIRYGVGNRAFMTMTDRDWTSQRDKMQRYVIGESENFQNTQLTQQLQTGLKEAADNYGSDDSLQAVNRRNDFMIAARYYNYGPERIKLEQDKVRAATVNTAITAAINADDYNRAGEMLQAYGDYLTPEAKMNFDKSVQTYRNNNMQVMQFKDLYARYGDDVNAALAEMDNNGAFVNTVAGMDYARASIGEQRGVNQCANFTSDYIRAAGGDTALCSSLADGTYRNFEEKGLVYTNRNELRDGDIVFWQVDGSGYGASNNPAAVESGSEAYKGITHVGVYDAKTGKVIQSGTHGISAMDMDAKGYHVVGFGRVGGRSTSPAEMEKKKNAYMAYARSQRAQKQYNENLLVDNASNQMLSAYNNGVRDPQYFMQIAKSVAGNDYSMYSTLTNVAEAFGNAGTYKLNAYEEVDIENRIDSGRMSDAEVVEELKNKNVSAATINKYRKRNIQARSGEGKYSYSWDSLVSATQERLGTKLTAEDQMGIKRYGMRFVDDYSKKNGMQPSTDEILDVMQEGMIKGVGGVNVPGIGFFSSDIEYNNAQLANHGIYYIQKAGNGNVAVYFYGNAEPVIMDEIDFRNEME